MYSTSRAFFGVNLFNEFHIVLFSSYGLDLKNKYAYIEKKIPVLNLIFYVSFTPVILSQIFKAGCPGTSIVVPFL